MKFPRWLVVAMLSSSALAVLLASGWWWTTGWPHYTAVEYVLAVQSGREDAYQVKSKFMSPLKLMTVDERAEFELPNVSWIDRGIGDTLQGRQRFNVARLPFVFTAERGSVDCAWNGRTFWVVEGGRRLIVTMGEPVGSGPIDQASTDHHKEAR